MRCPTYRKRPFLIYPLGLTQINHGHLPLFIDHEIRGLDIPINIPLSMKGLHYQPHLRDNQSSEILIEWACHLQEFMEWKALD